jgi:hypothetical protein
LAENEKNFVENAILLIRTFRNGKQEEEDNNILEWYI